MTYIDSQVQNFLDQMAAGGGDATEAEPTMAEQRAAFSALWRSLSPPAAEIAAREELSVPGEAGDIPCLLYRPRQTDEPLPVLVFYHGGGCCTLSPEDFEATSTALARDGDCLVVVPRFRQAPENPFPAPLEDSYAAYRWCLQHAAEFGGDPGRIAIGGDSGGGYLAAAVCLEAKRDAVAQPLLQVLIYPMIDMAGKAPSRVARDYFVNDAALTGVIALHCGDQVLDPRASPIRASSHEGLAPAFVITTTLDPLEDEGRAYVEKLRADGVQAAHFSYEGMVHGFFSFGGAIDQGNAAVQHVAGVLRDAFRRH
ncbi:MAG: alpha/beta hydrolase [Pseudomonadota bacterium]